MPFRFGLLEGVDAANDKRAIVSKFMTRYTSVLVGTLQESVIAGSLRAAEFDCLERLLADIL